MVKGLATKYETLSEGSVKLSIYFPKELKRQVLELSDEDVVVTLYDSDMVSIPKAEYEALKAGGAWVIPEAKRQALKIMAATLLDWCEG